MNLPVLGAQLEGALGSRDKWIVPDRAYHFSLPWDEIEKQPGIYTFPAWTFETVQGLNDKLGEGNYRLVIGVKTCPTFYSLPPNARNSPPQEQYYTDFAKFIEAVWLMFHPWGVEVWNEPEFSVLESAQWQEYFGGFGLDGAGYGRMVRVIWEHVLRGAANEMQVIGGASFGLVDVDRALRFLEDAVGAGMKSDYYSFHAYWKYSDVIYGRRDFFQALWFADQAHKIFPVPQIISETSIRRDTWREELEAHREAQAELLKFYLKYLGRSEVKSVWWYALADNYWEHTDMAEGDVKYPVYDIWKNYTEV